MKPEYEMTNEEFDAMKEKIIADRIAYFENLKEVPMDYTVDYEVEKIEPSEMKVGDLMEQYGNIFKITEIKVFEKDDPRYPVYQAIGTYIGGSLSIYKTFTQIVANGCARNHLTYKQGNAKANWLKVTLK